MSKPNVKPNSIHCCLSWLSPEIEERGPGIVYAFWLSCFLEGPLLQLGMTGKLHRVIIDPYILVN